MDGCGHLKIDAGALDAAWARAAEAKKLVEMGGRIALWFDGD